MASGKATNGLGLGVDASGGPTYDPSANVIALTDTANRRQDDLREAFERYQAKEIQNVKEQAKLRAYYETRLSQAESKRIDAIRAVDVNSVAVASEKQTAAASVLASQVAASADALRTLVATTAATMAEQQRMQMGQVTDRITAVERSQYEGRGKAGLADPMLAELIAEMKAMRDSQTKTGGKSEGGQAVWGYIALGISLLAIILSGAFALINFNPGGGP